MGKILICGDIHGRQFWKDAVEKHGDECDKVIFLGDYLDPYNWEGITRKDTIKNFEEIINYKLNNKDKVVLLIGNHDMCYWSKDFKTRSRYDSSNAWHIIEDFKSHRSIFELAHAETVGGKRYLFSHAGLMKSWIERNNRVVTDITPEGLTKLLYVKDGIIALMDISRYRTWLGEKTGSIVWSDIMEKTEFPDDSNIDGYDYQVFGHTQQEEHPIITKTWACLDCRKAFILTEDGGFQEA